jgi:hypothetical protein
VLPFTQAMLECKAIFCKDSMHNKTGEKAGQKIEQVKNGRAELYRGLHDEE